ncbi:coiled-coil domain-containing protein 122-like isoform X2 [Notolabrus celidotus]|uniref:coiled-coil domain-containing protein 122-like isoform X2 n=1 Tax=Notolabrus celidotus TaxID=1203425 RepID=UPI00148FCDD1|nr:coiled-coil domain-containing protein 122-like isoform X2 [Notolabrus celidotus]
MSNFKDNEDEDQPGLSLTKAVEDVSHHGYAQTVALEEKQKILSSLQLTLKNVALEDEAVEQDLKANVRDTLLLKGEMEQLGQQVTALYGRCVSISKDISNLQVDISEEEEKAGVALEGFNTYRNKMETHRAAALRAASQTEAKKELEEKRELVRMLKEKKEELREDLENPYGNTVQMKEIAALNEEISVMSKTIEEKREKLHEESTLHTHIKKDIAIQNKRYEAIVRRLHCQMSRAQGVHRQLSADIHHLERQLDELKRQQESSQGLAVGGH